MLGEAFLQLFILRCIEYMFRNWSWCTHDICILNFHTTVKTNLFLQTKTSVTEIFCTGKSKSNNLGFTQRFSLCLLCVEISFALIGRILERKIHLRKHDQTGSLIKHYIFLSLHRYDQAWLRCTKPYCHRFHEVFEHHTNQSLPQGRKCTNNSQKATVPLGRTMCAGAFVAKM